MTRRLRIITKLKCATFSKKVTKRNVWPTFVHVASGIHKEFTAKSEEMYHVVRPRSVQDQQQNVLEATVWNTLSLFISWNSKGYKISENECDCTKPCNFIRRKSCTLGTPKLETFKDQENLKTIWKRLINTFGDEPVEVFRWYTKVRRFTHMWYNKADKRNVSVFTRTL
jgi:hypothetical protein